MKSVSSFSSIDVIMQNYRLLSFIFDQQLGFFLFFVLGLFFFVFCFFLVFKINLLKKLFFLSYDWIFRWKTTRQQDDL